MSTPSVSLIPSLLAVLLVLDIATFSGTCSLASASSHPPLSPFNPAPAVLDESVTSPVFPLGTTYTNAVYDSKNRVAYLLTATNTGSAVCRYSVEEAAYSPKHCISSSFGPESQLRLQTGVIHAGIAFFGGSIKNPIPAQSSRLPTVCAVNISQANFSFLKCATTHFAGDSFTSSIVDNSTGLSYFGASSDDNDGGVCLIDISSSNNETVSFVSCLGAMSYHTALIDEGMAYFAGGEVCKYSLMSHTTQFAFERCVSTNSGALFSSILDATNHYGYFASGTVLVKLQLAGTLLLLDSISTGTGGLAPSIAIFDQAGQVGYFLSVQGSRQTDVLRVNLSPNTFAVIGSSTTITLSAAFVTSSAPDRIYIFPRRANAYVCELSIIAFPSVNCSRTEEVPGNMDSSGNWRSAIFDTTQTESAFFAGIAVCKFDISNDTPKLLQCLRAFPVSSPFQSYYLQFSFLASAFDTSTGLAFFATSGDPYTQQDHVCAFNLRNRSAPHNFSFSHCISNSNTQSSQVSQRSAVIDSLRSLLIVNNGFTDICVFNVSSLNDFTTLKCLTESLFQKSLGSSVYDTANARLYVNCAQDLICRFDISLSSPFISYDSCVRIVSSQPSSIAFISNDFVYFDGVTTQGNLFRINVSSSNFTVDSSATCGSQLYSGFIDSSNNKAYLIGYQSMMTFEISKTSFRYLSYYLLFLPSQERIVTSTFDSSRNLAFLATESYPGRIFKVATNSFSCSSFVEVRVNEQHQLQTGTLWITSFRNDCHLSINNVTLSGIRFVNGSASSSSLCLSNVTFADSVSCALFFSEDTENLKVSLTSIVSFHDKGLTLVSFGPSKNIDSSLIIFANNTLERGSFLSFSGSSTIISNTNFTFNSNRIPASLATSASIAEFKDANPFDLGSSEWNFGCSNDWMNGYFNRFETQTTNGHIAGCHRRTHTASPSMSLSDSVFCLNLNQQQCSEVGVGNCHFCSNRNLCVPRDQDCSCSPFSESICSLATGCHFCSNASVCVGDDLECDCFVFDESSCKVASACRWCSNFKSCLTLPETCYCSTLSKTVCSTLTQNECTYCPEQEICLPTADFTKNTCSCLNMNSSNCQTSKCSWCSNYETCGLPNWDCDCTSLSNTSASSCSTDSNNHCKLCQEESVCVDAQNFTCRCENFTESVCDSSSCRWCDTLNSCTVPENTNCSCYLIRGQQSCDVNTENICHFCPTVDSCLPREQQCYCSALQSDTCSLWTNNSCTYCPEQKICLPTTEVNQNTCSCLKLNSTNCHQSTCSWCDNYQTCGLPSWDCVCTSLSNMSASSCSVNSNNHCKLCLEESVCVDTQKVSCRCENFTESVCDSSSCKWCDTLNSCTVPQNDECNCYLIRGEQSCNEHSNGKCHFCSDFDSCLPMQEKCYCSSLGQYACASQSDNKCTYCPEQQICLPTTEVNQSTCSCLKMNSSNCQESTCSWCSNYQTCGLPSWDCNCLSLSNSSSSCAVNSNNHCKLCQNESVCVDAQNFTCRCEDFTESVCDSSFCRWCDTLNSCTIPENEACNCYLLRGQQSCNQNSNGKCHFCSNFDSCLPLNEQCYCSTLSQYACTSESDGKCTYCPEQQICLPTADFTKNTCSCLNMNSSNCQTSKCSWCDNYETCGLPNWDCDCTSLSNTSASSCSTDSNNHCKLCQEESVCVDAQNFTCRCENFTQSVCGSTSSCSWCDDLGSCTVRENVNCTCNWLRGEDACNRNSNNKCSWCSTSSDTGNNGYYRIENFDYCINNDGEDQCQCSYLSPSFCSFANDPIQNEIDNFSTACRYCAISSVCAHPANKNCDCGNFATAHSCGVASLCSWKEPVLTFDGATEYCSAASVTCSPVTCAGILSKASCESAGCGWNSQTLRCDSKSACFNFFVGGFTPQPMILWIIGLVKDVLVVFLVGAFANTFTRPIMKFISAVKKQVLKQTHIKQRTMEDTVYMSDKHCRDDVTISFPRYVELVCESVFQLENDDLLDEENRLVLFDAVAYTLFDNMIWVDIDLLERNIKQEEVNYQKRFGLSNLEPPSQHEMRDLTVDETDDMKDDDTRDHKEGERAELEVKGDDLSEKRLTTREVLEIFFAAVISTTKDFGDTSETDVNTRGQIFGQFIAAATTKYDTYLKTKNVDLLKIKVLLTAQDFESAVTLRKKVDDCLLERASAYVFYDQSRDRKVCAATSANTFPPALNLVYYSVALVFLFITSFITVRFYPNITRMVQSCNVVASANVTNSSDNATNSSSRVGDDGPTSEFTLNSSNLTGAYFLLGFRLLNSSAFSTAILVFVKVIRGLYQRYSGIYTLSLQERIPLMALYSDRFIHVMLILYALLVLPFALCGPTYGSSFGIYCWVPIFIAAAILIGDALVLYVSRRFTSLKNRLLNKKDESEDDEKQKALSKTFADLNQDFEDFLDSPSVSRMKLQDGVSRIPSAKAEQQEEEKTQQPEGTEDDQENNSLSENLLSPREGDEDEDAENSNNKPKGDEANNTKEETKLDEEVIKNQSSIESLSPVDLWNAILVFIMTEEIPVIVISLALQLSFNYAALLHYGDAFGLSVDKGNVYGRDYDSRSVKCLVSVFENDVSSFVSGLSSFVPFM